VAKRRGFALAKPVGVHYGDQIVQLVNTRERRRFPNGAFGDFAIAHQDVGVVIKIVEARGSAMPTPTPRPWPSEPVATSANARRGGRMAFEFTGELTERQQFGIGTKTIFRPRGVKQRRGVAFREDETVVVVIVRVLGVVAHLAKEKRGHDVRCRTAGSRMTAARCGGRFNG